MIRFSALVLLTSALVAVAASADDPPEVKADDLKVKPEQGPGAKKDRPDREKGKEKKKDEDEAKKTKELIARINKGMQQSEKRLGDKDPRDTTQQIQRDVVKDIDELIKKARKDNEDNQSSSSGGGGGGGSQGGAASGRKSQGGGSGGGSNRGGANQGGAQGKSGQGGEMKQGQSKGGGQGKGGARSKGKNGGKSGQGKQQGKGKGKSGKSKGGLGKNKEPGKNGGGNIARAKDLKSRQNPLADMFRDIWGHLPEMRRMEMDAYGRERFMRRYDELLQQYYRTISEQKQR